MVSDFSGLVQQPVVLERSAGGSFGMQFTVDPDLRDCDVYTIGWTSLIDSHAQFFYVTFGSPNFQVMGSVEFRNDGQMSANGSGNVLASTYAPWTAQVFEVRLDVVNTKLSVSIDGVPDPNGQDLDHIQLGADGLKTIGLAFGMLDHYTVAFDDLHVTGEGCPGVANEGRSWGNVKAMFR